MELVPGKGHLAADQIECQFNELERHRVRGPELHGIDALRGIVGLVLVVGDDASGQVLAMLGEIGLTVEGLQIDGPAQTLDRKIIVIRIRLAVLEVQLWAEGIDVCDEELHLQDLHRSWEILAIGVELKGRSVLDRERPAKGREGRLCVDDNSGAQQDAGSYCEPHCDHSLFHHRVPSLTCRGRFETPTAAVSITLLYHTRASKKRHSATHCAGGCMTVLAIRLGQTLCAGHRFMAGKDKLEIRSTKLQLNSKHEVPRLQIHPGMHGQG